MKMCICMHICENLLFQQDNFFTSVGNGPCARWGEYQLLAPQSKVTDANVAPVTSISCLFRPCASFRVQMMNKFARRGIFSLLGECNDCQKSPLSQTTRKFAFFNAVFKSIVNSQENIKTAWKKASVSNVLQGIGATFLWNKISFDPLKWETLGLWLCRTIYFGRDTRIGKRTVYLKRNFAPNVRSSGNWQWQRPLAKHLTKWRHNKNLGASFVQDIYLICTQ